MRCSICDKEIGFMEYFINNDKCEDCNSLSNVEKEKILEKRKDPNFDTSTLWKEKNLPEVKHSTFIKVTKFMAVVFLILCFIGGFVIGDEIRFNSYDFNTALMLASWIIGFLNFSIIYGIACIVENTNPQK